MSKSISSRVVLPADALSGVYDPVANRLTLSARGSYSLPISRGQFIRLRWFGGWTFLLVGWTFYDGPGPEGQKLKFPFEVDTHFILPYHGEPVTVIDLNNPRGVKVRIDWLGLKKDDTNEPKQGTPEESNQVPDKTVLDNNTIYTVEGEKFTISAPASSTYYTYQVNSEFNRDFLTLEDSKIEAGRIIWTFTAKKLGTTQVVVTEFGAVKPGHIGAWWQEQTYDVYVLLRNEHRDVVVA